MKFPETCLGYKRGEHFASPEDVAHDRAQDYSSISEFGLNGWTLAGNWTIEDERSIGNTAQTRIAYKFRARDVHLVLGSNDDKPVRFRVTIDGKPPGADRGGDIDADGTGTIVGERLYQLIRKRGPVKDHQFEIEFLDPGAQAFAFTFG